RFGIDDEDGDINHVVESATSRDQDRVQVVEGKPDLILQIRLGRSMILAAGLSGHEQKANGANRRRVAIALIKRLPSARTNHVTRCHKPPRSKGRNRPETNDVGTVRTCAGAINEQLW